MNEPSRIVFRARLLSFAALLVGTTTLGCKASVSGGGAQQPLEAAGPGSAGVPKGGNLFKVATFDGKKSLPWMSVFSAPGDGDWAVENEAYCIDITNAGTNRWDAQIRHREMVIQKGHKYTLQFRAWASHPTKAYPKVGMSGPPYDEYFGTIIKLDTVPQNYAATFEARKDDDPTAEFAIHLGGGLAQGDMPLKVCIDDAYLADEDFTAPSAEDEVERPDVRVNQVGYLPGLAKVAVVVSDASEPQDWNLLGGDGKTVASGKTTVFGDDEASGDHVHQVDFSSFKTPGTGYVLQVGDKKSDPFDISKDVYRKLKYDALAYFYHNRSGIEIAMPYAGEEQYARPAGHKPDIAICTPGTVLKQTGWDSEPCDYELDVTGGWYDAGDQGKYVVNGGIAVWTLLNQYETLQRFGKSLKDFGDGKMNIPEAGNKLPDLLDEVRWELDFLLSMRVPKDKPLAGMVHHKMHDAAWTALALPPHKDPQKRLLRPATTAATLNLAAVAAQAARIFKTVDVEYAVKLLSAAEEAYEAAKAHPDLFAPDDGQAGGGPYDDNDVSDEFYWAAAELYASTGKGTYLTELHDNKHHKQLSMANGVQSIMTWRDTDGLGAITLAVAKSQLSKSEQDAQRARLIAVADKYLETAGKDGYRPPFKGGGEGYPWGSNSFVVNNAIVMALAYDFTGDSKYLDGVGGAMDYLLGRNALAQSYVSGYGERALTNPHHRFWSHQASPLLPLAPAGCLSGGPNSGLQDPYVKAAGLAGCKPQKCWVDNIEAWSVNEITINWNAPLAWVAAFLDDQGRR